MTGLARRLRRLRMGLATVTGLDRQGYFIPCRYAGALPASAEYSAIERLFSAHRQSFLDLVDGLERYADDLRAIGSDDPAPGPRWNQDWFPRMDAAIAYAMVRTWKPRRIVEVGSGHSTRFMARAIADGCLPTSLVTIDPAPRAPVPCEGVTLVKTPLHEADPSLMATLEKGDILFIDSSHIAMPGSDVDHLLNRIAPDLPEGVIVHVHDMFLPFDYPQAWSWRGYNEQLAVAPMLTCGAWKPIFSSRYMTQRHPDCLESGVLADLPLPEGALETSLWMSRPWNAIWDA